MVQYILKGEDIVVQCSFERWVQFFEQIKDITHVDGFNKVRDLVREGVLVRVVEGVAE